MSGLESRTEMGRNSVLDERIVKCPINLLTTTDTAICSLYSIVFFPFLVAELISLPYHGDDDEVIVAHSYRLGRGDVEVPLLPHTRGPLGI